MEITRQNIVLKNMKESLKQKIYTKVKGLGYCPLNLIHEIAAEGNYKQSTAEKKSRELAEVGSIVPVYNLNGHLTGYSKGKAVIITYQKPETASNIPISSPRHPNYQKEVKTPLRSNKRQLEPIGQLSLL